MHATFGVQEASGLAQSSLYQSLSKDVEGLAAFWTKAKYGKMGIEGPDLVNT